MQTPTKSILFQQNNTLIETKLITWVVQNRFVEDKRSDRENQSWNGILLHWYHLINIDPDSPITIVSSGISSIKHFFSVSPMWKYNPWVRFVKKHSATTAKTDHMVAKVSFQVTPVFWKSHACALSQCHVSGNLWACGLGMRRFSLHSMDSYMMCGSARFKMHAATERKGVDVCLAGSDQKTAPKCPHGRCTLY